jgi:hypothetical protein
MPKANRLINWIKMSHYYWCSQHGYGFFHFCQTLMNLYAITSHIDIGVVSRGSETYQSCECMKQHNLGNHN